jgi:branched-subunit amino acid transport protein AzlD
MQVLVIPVDENGYETLSLSKRRCMIFLSVFMTRDMDHLPRLVSYFAIWLVMILLLLLVCLKTQPVLSPFYGTLSLFSVLTAARIESYRSVTPCID